MTIHSLSFPTFGLTCSVWDVVNSGNCVNYQHPVVSYLLTWLLCTSNQNLCFSWIRYGCRERRGVVSMVGSLHSSSMISPQRPLRGASISSLRGRVQVLLRLCSATNSGQIDRMYIYTETYIMHAILRCRESCDCNKDEYDKSKCHEVMYEQLLWEYGTKSHAVLCSSLGCSRSFPQSCASVLAALEVSCRSAERSQELQNWTIL